MIMTDYEYRIEVLEREIKAKQKRLLDLKQEEEIFKATLTDICPVCKGSREESYTDAAGDTDTRACSVCKGYGKINPIKCKCGKVISIDMIGVRMQEYPQCPWCGRSLKV